jgi:hypothetical protein
MPVQPDITSDQLTKFQIVWACATTIFFVYTVLAWRGLLGRGDRGTTLIASALAMQAIAPLAGHRARWLQGLLLGASLLALWFSIWPR